MEMLVWVESESPFPSLMADLSMLFGFVWERYLLISSMHASVVWIDNGYPIAFAEHVDFAPDDFVIYVCRLHIDHQQLNDCTDFASFTMSTNPKNLKSALRID